MALGYVVGRHVARRADGRLDGLPSGARSFLLRLGMTGLHPAVLELLSARPGAAPTGHEYTVRWALEGVEPPAIGTVQC